VVVNRSITASMLGVTCQIGGFVASGDIQGVSPPLKLRVQFNMQCECCKWNQMSFPYNFCLRGYWRLLATLATPGYTLDIFTACELLIFPDVLCTISSVLWHWLGDMKARIRPAKSRISNPKRSSLEDLYGGSGLIWIDLW